MCWKSFSNSAQMTLRAFLQLLKLRLRFWFTKTAVRCYKFLDCEEAQLTAAAMKSSTNYFLIFQPFSEKWLVGIFFILLLAWRIQKDSSFQVHITSCMFFIHRWMKILIIPKQTLLMFCDIHGPSSFLSLFLFIYKTSIAWNDFHFGLETFLEFLVIVLKNQFTK